MKTRILKHAIRVALICNSVLLYQQNVIAAEQQEWKETAEKTVIDKDFHTFCVKVGQLNPKCGLPLREDESREESLFRVIGEGFDILPQDSQYSPDFFSQTSVPSPQEQKSLLALAPHGPTHQSALNSLSPLAQLGLAMVQPELLEQMLIEDEKAKEEQKKKYDLTFLRMLTNLVEKDNDTIEETLFKEYHEQRELQLREGDNIKLIPSEIGLLANLIKLNLSGNRIASIPSEIGFLNQLSTLDLSHNKITFLPTEIGKLTDLQEIHLEGNRLTSLPTEIGLLINLKVLIANSNNLASIPQEVGHLKKLEKLDLAYNNLTYLPPEVHSLGLQIRLNNNPGFKQ